MGRIIIHTGIDNSQLDKGLQRVEDATKKAGARAGSNLSALQKSFERSSNEASKLGAEYEKLVQKKAELESHAVSIQGKSFLYSTAQAELDAVITRMDEIAPKWEAAEQAAAEYEARIKEVNAIPPAEPIAPVDEVPPEADPRALALNFKSAASSVASFAKKAISSVGSIVSKVGSGIKSVAAKAISSVGSIVSRVGGGIKSVATKAASGIRSMASKISGFMRRSTKDTNGLTDAIGKTLNRIKQLLVTVLVFNVMRKAFKDFRDYIGAALSKNKEYVTSMGQLKSAMQAAFAPILTYIVPTIATLVSWLATAMSYIARFVQMMSGQVVTTNNAGDSTAALSKGMDDLAGSTKAAGDAAKKSLASFDLLSQMPDTSGGGGGGGGGGGAADIPAYEPVKIDTSWIDEFVKKLKSIDVDYEYFFDIGKRVGEWINKGLAAIDWDWIQAWVVSTVTKIAAFLNGVVAGIDWSLVGKTIAEGLNTVLIGAYTWLTTFDWLKFGQSIGDMINGAIYNIKWGLIGDTLAAYFMAAVNRLAGAINRIDWVYLGAHLALSIHRFFYNIDWEEVGKLVESGMKGALAFITTAITDTPWGQMGEDIRTFLITIPWGEIWDDFRGAISAAFTGLGDFIAGLLGLDTDLMTAIQSVKWNEIGGYLAQELNKLAGKINWGAIGQMLSDGMTDALAFLSTAVAVMDWEHLGIDVSTFLNNIDWMGLIGKCGELIGNGMLGALTFLNSAVERTDWNGIGLSVGAALRDIPWDEIWERFKDVLKSSFTGFRNFIAGLLGIESKDAGWEEIGAKVGSALQTIPWDKAWEEFKTFLESVFTGFGSFISGLFGFDENDEASFVSAGEALGGMLQTMINTGLSFIDTFNWGDAIISLMNGILEFLRGVDWGDLGGRISNAFKVVLGNLQTAFTSDEWQQMSITVGNAIREMILNIDWPGLGKLVAELVRGLFQGLGLALFTAIAGEDVTTGIKDVADSIGTNLEKIRAISEEKYNELIDLQAEYAGTEMGQWVFAAKVDQTLSELQENMESAVGEMARGSGRVKKAVQDAHDYKPTGPAGMVEAFDESAEAIAKGAKEVLGDAVSGGIKTGTDAGAEHVKGLGKDVSDSMATAGASAEKEFSEPTDKAFGDTAESATTDMEKLGVDTEAIFAPIADTAEKDFAQPVEKTFSVLFTGTKKDNEELVSSIKEIWSPVPAWFEANFHTPIRTGAMDAWKAIGHEAATASESIQSAFSPMAGWFDSSVINSIKTSFTGLWSEIRAGINKTLANVEYGLNSMADAVNRMRITIPPIPNPFGGQLWGGATVGLYMNGVALPRLATGAVIPPNKEFAAILGDQKTGTNIEAPENLIRQIVREEISNAGGNRTERFTAEATGQLAPLIRLLRIELKREDAREGVSLSNREVIA